MFFKNASFYKIGENRKFTVDELRTALEQNPFVECLATQTFNSGFVSPIEGDDRLVVQIKPQFFAICLKRQEKIIPSSSVKESVDKKIKELQQDNVPIDKKLKLETKQNVQVELATRALSKIEKTMAYFDLENGWLVIDTASAKKAEHLLSNTPIECENGKKLSIIATAIDAGGHRTEAVKDYVRRKQIKRPLAIFGATSTTAPVLSKPKATDVNFRGQLNKFGVHIQHVGTIQIKHKIFARLSADADKESPERSLHFSEQLEREFFAGFTSETFDPKTGRFVNKRGARNEPLDTYVYAYAAAHHHELRLHTYSKARWAELVGEISSPTEPIGANSSPVESKPKKSFFIPD
ncbi:MAG: terminase gpA endonuclease subunit [Methylococcaceae bacterium]